MIVIVRPDPNEVFLGLTKGGVELNYNPEWYEITVDLFGNTLTDAFHRRNDR